MANSVFFSDRNSGYQHLSESVYIGLCRHVGTSKQLIMRRQILDVRELIENQCKTHDPRRPQIYLYTSGSHREGFRLAGSDRDFMYWVSDHKVIWGLSQVQNYTSDRYVLILADDNESPPGFFLSSNFSHQLTGIKLHDLVSKSEMTFLFQVLSSEKSFAQL